MLSYEEAATDIWQILTAIGALVTAVSTIITMYILAVQSMRSRPIITFIEKGYGDGIFNAIVANRRQLPITIDDIFYKKRFLKIFFTTKKDAEWNLPWKDESNQSRIQTAEKINTIIVGQATIHFKIPQFDDKATYKILINTSDGQCRKMIHPSSLESK